MERSDEDNFDREIYGYEDPPSELSNPFCLIFWHLNKEVRSVITSPAWKDKVKKGLYPFFCMHKGLCRYFESRESLEKHFKKNPDHRNVNLARCREESNRRRFLRQGSYLNKIRMTNSLNRSSSSPSPSPSPPPRRSSLSPPQTLLKRPPSPKEPHPDDEKKNVSRPPRREQSLEPQSPREVVNNPILDKLNLSMPKPDFLRSSSLQEFPDSSSVTKVLSSSRDPRKRKASLTNAMEIDKTLDSTLGSKMARPATPPKKVEAFTTPPPKANLGKGKSITLGDYLKHIRTPVKSEEQELVTELPSLPSMDELFGSVEDNPEVQDVQEEKEEVQNAEKEEKEEDTKIDDELEMYLSKKSTKVSSWIVSKTSSTSNEEATKASQDDKEEEKTIEEQVVTLTEDDLEACSTQDMVITHEETIEDEDVIIETFENQDGVSVSVAAEVEVKAFTPVDENTVVLISGVDKSVDYCSNCGTRLCPFRGGYTLNVVTFDVTLDCLGCKKRVVVKDLLNDRQKTIVWNGSI